MNNQIHIAEADRLEFQAIRYVYRPVLIVPLSSGRFAVSVEGNPFPLTFVCAPEHLSARLEATANDQRRAHETRLESERNRPQKIVDLSFLDLGDL